MVPDRLTRREALSLSSVTLVGLAGCTTQGSKEPTNASDADGLGTPTVTERQYSNSVDAPESRKVRNAEGNPAVRSSVHSPEQDIASSGSLESAPGWDHEYWFVTSPRERDALEFSPKTTEVEAAKDFIADTNLSEETVIIQQYRNEECMTVYLKQIRWEEVGDGPEGRFAISMDYEDTERDGDCEHATEQNAPQEIHAIISRIPVDVEDVKSFRYGW